MGEGDEEGNEKVGVGGGGGVSDVAKKYGTSIKSAESQWLMPNNESKSVLESIAVFQIGGVEPKSTGFSKVQSRENLDENRKSGNQFGKGGEEKKSLGQFGKNFAAPLNKNKKAASAYSPTNTEKEA